MTITPSTDLYLLKLPIELDDENQLTFASASDQATYFQSLTKLTEDKFTYQRRESAIRFPAHIDSIIEYNYVMYKNSNYSNKWFYARVMNMEYINDNMTLITIEEDSFQTWQFDLVYNQCFVEREHVNNDAIGANTTPENLELGPIATNIIANVDASANIVDSEGNTKTFLVGAQVVVFQVTAIPDALKPTSSVAWEVAGTFSATPLLAVKKEDAIKIIRAYQEYSSDRNINSVFMAPAKALNRCYYETKTVTINGTTYSIDVMYPNTYGGTGVIDMSGSDVTIDMPSKLYDNFTPKNNKLFCWPFNYFYVSNRVGEIREFHYEDFTNNTPKFRVLGCLSQGCSIKLVPTNSYKLTPVGAAGVSGLEYGVNCRKFPVCPWTSDSYTNWLTQNGVNVVGGVIGTVAAAAAGVGATLITGGATIPAVLALAGAGIKVASSLASTVQAATLPDIASGDTSMGDLAQAAWSQGLFAVYKQSIRPEYATIIDNYFSAYGYKINLIKTPNTTGRTNWNYVKTVGSTIHGYLPEKSVKKINSMFDKGITLWHNPSTFKDYSQSNAIVTP